MSATLPLVVPGDAMRFRPTLQADIARRNYTAELHCGITLRKRRLVRGQFQRAFFGAVFFGTVFFGTVFFGAVFFGERSVFPGRKRYNGGVFVSDNRPERSHRTAGIGHHQRLPHALFLYGVSATFKENAHDSNDPSFLFETFRRNARGGSRDSLPFLFGPAAPCRSRKRSTPYRLYRRRKHGQG